MKRSDGESNVGRGAIFLYIESISTIISGFVFWMIVSKVANTDIIGASSAAMSFAGILSVVAGIGISACIQRFLGKHLSEQKLFDAKLFVISSIILVSTGIFVCSILILAYSSSIYDTFKIEFELLVVTLFLMATSTLMMLFRSVIISSLDTKNLPLITTISVIAKIILAIIFIFQGMGAIGLTLGVVFSQIIFCILSGYVILKIFRSVTYDRNLSVSGLICTSTIVLRSGLAFWIPLLITTIGSQLGIIVLFGSEGAEESAVYFIALTIVNGLSTIVFTLFTIVLPALSAMNDGRKRFMWQAIRFTGFITLPFASSLIFYSKDIMNLIGSSYIDGTNSLQILLLSIFPTIIFSGVNDLVHSYGKYRQVLIIGLVISIPRTAFYFILIPLYGDIGASIAYTIGALAGMMVSYIIAKKICLHINWQHMLVMFLIPLGLSFVMSYVQLNYIIGIAVTMLISYLILIGLRIISKLDILFSLGLLPSRISKPLINIVNLACSKLRI